MKIDMNREAMRGGESGETSQHFKAHHQVGESG